MEKRQKRITNTQEWWVYSLIGGLIGLAIAVVLVLSMPLLLLRMGDTSQLILPTVAICLFIGGGIGGIIGASNAKGNEIVSGLLCGGEIIAIMLLISFLFKKGFNLIGFIVLAATAIISSVLGAFAIMKSHDSQKRNMNKIMKRR